MKSLRLAVAIILMNLFLVSSYGLNQSRFEWWKQREAELARERKVLAGRTDMDPRLMAALDRDLERTREILRLMKLGESGPAGKGESSEGDAPSPKSLMDSICLEHVLAEGESRESVEAAARSVELAAAGLVKERFGRGDGETAKYLMQEEVSLPRLRLLAAEMTMVRAMNLAEGERGVPAATDKEGSVKTIRGRERIKNRLKGVGDSALLERCAVWKKIRRRMEMRLQGCLAIGRWMEESRMKYSPAETAHFMKNPLSLDARTFGALIEEYGMAYPQKEADSQGGEGDKRDAPEIPRIPPITPLLKTMDQTRKKALLGIQGRENEEYFQEIDRRLQNLIRKQMKPSEEMFRRLETDEKPGGNAEKEGEGKGLMKKPSAFQREIQVARGLLDGRRKLAESYRDRSMAFLRMVSLTRKGDGNAVMGDFRIMAESASHSVEYLERIMRDTLEAADLDREEKKNRLALYTLRNSQLYSLLLELPYAERDEYPFLQPDQVREMKNTRAAMTVAVKKSRQRISGLARALQRANAKEARLKKVRDNRAGHRLAQYELEILLSGLRDYEKLHESMNYAEEAFAGYLIVFNGLNKQAEKGDVSLEMEKTLREKSLLSLVPGFDRKRIQREYKTRKFAAGKISLALSRIFYLVEFYRKNHLALSNYPSRDEVRELNRKIEKRLSVDVSQWKMDEKNFEMVDKKAVTRLTLHYHKNIWRKGSGRKEGSPGETMRIMEEGLRFDLPAGWREKRVSQRDREKGITRQFMTPDGKAMIQVAVYSPDGKDARGICEIWLKRMGKKIIKEKWGKKDDLEYFWSIAGDDHRTVLESYVFPRGSKVIILSGETMRGRYGFFKNKMEDVFQSVSR